MQPNKKHVTGFGQQRTDGIYCQTKKIREFAWPLQARAVQPTSHYGLASDCSITRFCGQAMPKDKR